MGYGDDDDRQGLDELEAVEAAGGALELLEALERWAAE
jgi:hypothetical protein